MDRMLLKEQIMENIQVFVIAESETDLKISKLFNQTAGTNLVDRNCPNPMIIMKLSLLSFRLSLYSISKPNMADPICLMSK